MALRMAELAHRSIPDSAEWQDFRFGRDGRLYCANQRLSWSAGELEAQEWEKQISYENKVRREQLEKQLTAVRSNEERSAIIAELEDAIDKLEKLSARLC